MKTKLLSLLIASMGFSATTSAQDFVIDNYDSKTVGESYVLSTSWGTDVGVATVKEDPAKKGNALHIATTDYNGFPYCEVTLPAGKTLADYVAFAFDIYILPSEKDGGPNWKQASINIDGVDVYVDDGYPNQASLSTWTTKAYAMDALKLTDADKAKTSFKVTFGINSNVADYYVDNVKLISASSLDADGAYVVGDFEAAEIGDQLSVKCWSAGEAVAVVAEDPVNAANKVVHITTTNWDGGVLLEAVLPTGMKLGDFKKLSYDIYVGPNAGDEYPTWKAIQIFMGTNSVYKGADGTEVAPQSTWTTNELALDELTLTDEHKALGTFTLGLGLNTNTGDYYLDNIKLLTDTGGTGVKLVKVANFFVDGATLYINSEKAADVVVYDVNGCSFITVQQSSSVDLSVLPKGVYVVKIIVDGKTYTQKIVK